MICKSCTDVWLKYGSARDVDRREKYNEKRKQKSKKKQKVVELTEEVEVTKENSGKKIYKAE